MKLYRIGWAFKNNPIISGSHKWCLPGIDDCPTCHITGGAIGVEYPAVDISGIEDVKPYLQAWPVPLGRLDELRERIRSYFPEQLPLPPGTDFGTVVGRALAKLGDFAWIRKWTPLIAETALRPLEAEVGAIEAVPADLKFRGKLSPVYHVLHIASYISLHDSCVAERESCPGCGNCKTKVIGAGGRDPVLLARSMKIDGASVPLGKHIFRIQDHKTFILVTEEFKNAVEKLGLSDIAFTEMNTV